MTSKQFLLFGMGRTRRKLIYCEGGRLLDANLLDSTFLKDAALKTSHRRN